MLNLIVKNVKNVRIDKYLSKITSFNRSKIQNLIADKKVFLNQICVKKNNVFVNTGDTIKLKNNVSKSFLLKPEKILLDIVYQDDSIAVINKPSGMVTHPAPGHKNATLVNALLYALPSLSDINGSLRPGIVHRLDKDTSGLLLIAKTNEAHRSLAKQLVEHKILREYVAIAKGKLIDKKLRINLPVGRGIRNRKKMVVRSWNSKNALTYVEPVRFFKDTTMVRCILKTGRTHQIRVHLSHIHHPILGDAKYGRSNDSFGQYLHAEKISFLHPLTKKKMIFTCPIPKKFQQKISELEGK